VCRLKFKPNTSHICLERYLKPIPSGNETIARTCVRNGFLLSIFSLISFNYNELKQPTDRPSDRRLSVGIVRLRTKSHGVFMNESKKIRKLLGFSTLIFNANIWSCNADLRTSCPFLRNYCAVSTSSPHESFTVRPNGTACLAWPLMCNLCWHEWRRVAWGTSSTQSCRLWRSFIQLTLKIKTKIQK
jgi:hypothetical protein